ncbi:MAG: hypothetical protein D6828_04710 [Nitrospirae bacterium]|nr:MAG: hypothetical protein D6828_04710 [Nitrospirota bacterium]
MRHDDDPFSIYMALDGPHLDGLIGSAGLLQFDWPEKNFYITHFEGVSAAHNVSLSPDGNLAILGNFSQQLVLLDISNPKNVKIKARQSMMYIEECPYRLRSNTHHLWFPDNEHFIGAVGDHLYRFHIDRLNEPENLGPHKLYNAHEIRWDAERRYILIGDLGPDYRDARQIAVFDLKEPDLEKRSRVIQLPETVWHCCVHPKKPVGYALTYSTASPQGNYVEWSPSYTREYIFEVDLPSAKISRIWSCGAEYPIHLNSDVSVTEDNYLYVSSGGSHSVVEISLENFEESRVLHCIPDLRKRIFQFRQRAHNVLGALCRRPTIINTHYILQTLLITNWRLMDGIYATRISPKGKYIVTGNRGYNVVSVYDRKTFKKLYSKLLPFRRDIYKKSPHYRLGSGGYHLGIHHSEIKPR